MYPLAAQLLETATMLAVSDLEVSTAYYGPSLGFQILEKIDGLVLMQLGTMRLYLVTHSPPTPGKPNVSLLPPQYSDHTAVNLIFKVSDCRAVHAALEAQGLRFLAAPHAPSWGGWRCFTRDPDGYLIEFEES